MLKYTGHPLFDVGVATLTAFSGKQIPSQLTESDLDAAADFITREYTRQPLKSFLTVAFPNSGFTQPAFEKTPERRIEYAQRVLRNFRESAGTLAEQCVFTGEPAVAVAFGEKEGLPPGRAFRQHLPLTTGENVINFHPYGDAGVPVSGKAILAIQAFPLGCAKVAGRLLVVHSDNEEIILHFARNFLQQNLRSIQLAQQAGSSKLEEPHLKQQTLLIVTLLDAFKEQRDAIRDKRLFSLTAYNLSNGKDPKLEIYHLPLQIIEFLREMSRVNYVEDWSVIVRRAWELAPSPKKRGNPAAEEFQPRRNYLYEDLFALPVNARDFLRTYFLRIALRFARAERGDPRGNYSLREDVGLVSWKITARFLERIMNMEKERIEQIRKLGDQLADYVSGENDRKFFRSFFIERHYDRFRTTLIRANLAHAREGNPPFITFDPYIEIFEVGNEVARTDWSLARDLVLIRMVERLYQRGWLGKNPDAIPDESEETTDSNS